MGVLSKYDHIHMGRKEGASRYNVSRDLLTHYTGIHSFKKYSEKKKYSGTRCQALGMEWYV